MEDAASVIVDPLSQFAKDSVRLLNKCTKPDRKEFTKIVKATSVGIAVLGVMGFVIKLFFIPVNNLLVGA